MKTTPNDLKIAITTIDKICRELTDKTNEKIETIVLRKGYSPKDVDEFKQIKETFEFALHFTTKASINIKTSIGKLQDILEILERS